jgi:YidC/Oxa1 family membrane protein insertase
LETRGVETVEVLLEAGFQVTVRPHPMTRKLAPQKISELINRFGGHPSFSFDTDQGSNDSLHAANIMVSDWSGVALEFAFGLEKPVIFVDVPLKLNNAEYSRLKAIPIEISLRDKIGTILPTEDIEKLPAVVAKLTGPPEGLAKELRGLRERYVYNVGKSAVTAANIINELAEARGSRQRQ